MDLMGCYCINAIRFEFIVIQPTVSFASQHVVLLQICKSRPIKEMANTLPQHTQSFTQHKDLLKCHGCDE